VSVQEDDLVAALSALRGGNTSLAGLRRVTGLTPRRIQAAVNLLVEIGAVHQQGHDVASTGRAAPEEVITRATEHVQARGRVEASRVEMMRGYAETTGCRRQFLLGYFGEDYQAPCGNCDTCLAGATGTDATPGTDARQDGRGAFRPSDSVAHATFGDGTVMRVGDDRIVVFFPDHGYKTLDLERVVDDGIMARKG
jgi:ATP-dependent DNA helicase RecQ